MHCALQCTLSDVIDGVIRQVAPTSPQFVLDMISTSTHDAVVSLYDTDASLNNIAVCHVDLHPADYSYHADYTGDVVFPCTGKFSTCLTSAPNSLDENRFELETLWQKAVVKYTSLNLNVIQLETNKILHIIRHKLTVDTEEEAPWWIFS